MEKYSLGIDIGGTFIKYALVDENYNIKEKWKNVLNELSQKRKKHGRGKHHCTCISGEKIHQAIQKLKPIQKERIIKFFFEDKSMRQIAEEEGINHSAVSKSIASAIENLKKFLIQGVHLTSPSGNK